MVRGPFSWGRPFFSDTLHRMCCEESRGEISDSLCS